jgi:hypothetical protein
MDDLGVGKFPELCIDGVRRALLDEETASVFDHESQEPACDGGLARSFGRKFRYPIVLFCCAVAAHRAPVASWLMR